jgi:hypothetical protein
MLSLPSPPSSKEKFANRFPHRNSAGITFSPISAFILKIQLKARYQENENFRKNKQSFSKVSCVF